MHKMQIQWAPGRPHMAVVVLEFKWSSSRTLFIQSLIYSIHIYEHLLCSRHSSAPRGMRRETRFLPSGSLHSSGEELAPPHQSQPVFVFFPHSGHCFLSLPALPHPSTHPPTPTHTPTLSSQPANLHSLLFVSSPRMPCLCICIYSSPMCLSVFFVPSRVRSSLWALHKSD